ncbi:MAG: hypothetical protein IIV03_04325, partial [Clostridia bacterium]|nr:hypothetical protein [Clostridia bacterium]
MSDYRRDMRTNAERTRTQYTRRFPIFWVLLLGFVIISVIYISGVINKVEAFLEEYESVQPKYVEAEVFDTYFKKIDYDKLLKAADRGDGEISEFETRDDLITYLKGLYEGKEISCYSISTGAANAETAELKLTDLAGYFVEQFNSKGDIRY